MGVDSSTRNVINVVVLGVSFMLVFTGFQTGSMIEPVVLDSVRNQTNGEYTGDGYTSLAVIYAVFAFFNWFAPPIVVFLGPKIAMITSALLYNLFVVLFVHPMTWALYFSSALVGIGAAVLWTAQGSYLTLISSKETMARNSGIFWALLQCSLLFGNLFVFFKFKGLISIDETTRNIVYGSLASVCFLGILTMLFLGRPATPDSTDSIVNVRGQRSDGPLKTFKKSLELFLTKRMALLCITFFYTGLELTFFSGVFGTSIGHTGGFAEDSKDLIGISGMIIGVGEIVGGLLFGILGDKMRRRGRDPIVVLGYVVHMVAFYLVFINLPTDSPIQDTDEEAYVRPSKALALVCSFLLGFADASFNTQLYSIVGVVYQDDSAPAFALFKFMQSAAAAVGFFYSNHLGLPYQLIILVISGTAGTASFLAVEWSVQVQDYDTLS